MAKNILVINVDIRETRVALIENGIIAELHIERETSKGTLGNIYLGKVTRVLPGMQAAFIDVGMERAAFLHVEDLIRPDDFEAYLSGSRRHEDAERFSKGDGGKRHGQAGVAQDPVQEQNHDHDHDESDEDEAEDEDESDEDEDEDETQAQASGEADAHAEPDADSEDAE